MNREQYATLYRALLRAAMEFRTQAQLSELPARRERALESLALADAALQALDRIPLDLKEAA